MLSPLSLTVAGFIQESPATFYVFASDLLQIFRENIEIQKATWKYQFQ
jgi:hypothetical protein